MKKIFHEFSAGCAGNGKINLATGELTFVHQTTDPDSSVLPVAISHVYRSNCLHLTSAYGKGWRLNLEQSLKKGHPDGDEDCTRYLYTDGAGEVHDFHQRYFVVRMCEESSMLKRVYQLRRVDNPPSEIVHRPAPISRSQIRIEQDGRMWLIESPTEEVFSEWVTDTGLMLQLRPKGYCGSKKIETRYEELIRVENDITALERTIFDLSEKINCNAKMKNSCPTAACPNLPLSEGRREIDYSRWEEDLKKAEKLLAQRKHAREVLITQLPVDFVIGEQILGFNEEGKLVSIFDNYDNQVAIVYQDGLIAKVVGDDNREMSFEYENGQLRRIMDFQNREFSLWSNGTQLASICTPNHMSSSFLYDGNGVLSAVMTQHNQHKKELVWSEGKLVSLSNQIAEHASEGEVSITYGSMHTTVTCSKTQDRVRYIFDSNNELLHQHIQGKYQRALITTRKTDEHEVVISRELTPTSNVGTITTEQSGWANDPWSLPSSFVEGLAWKATHLNAHGNPTHIRHSERALGSDTAGRQKADESFAYRDFLDGRRPKLLSSNLCIEKSNPNWGEWNVSRHLSKEYFYNKQGSLIRTLSEPDGIVEENRYNRRGAVVDSCVYHKSAPDKRFSTKAELAESGQVVATFDESGEHKTDIDYKDGTNIVTGLTDPRGGKTVFGRDSRSNQINSRSLTVDGERNGTTFEVDYETKLLTDLRSGNTHFRFAYDERGRRTDVDAVYDDKHWKVSGLVTYSYSDFRSIDLGRGVGLVEVESVTTEYANGEGFTSFLDRHGLLRAVRRIADGSGMFFFYDDCGRLVKTIDDFGRQATELARQTTEFEYDHAGRIERQLTKNVDGSELETKTEFDIQGNLCRTLQIINGRELNTYTSHGCDGQLEQIAIEEAVRYIYPEFDKLGRLVGTQLSKYKSDEEWNTWRENVASNEYTYLHHGEQATNMVSSHAQRLGNKFSKTYYSYDPNGNITQVRRGGQVVERYEYDALNRLVRDGEVEFGYDNNGNIEFRKEADGTVVEYEYDRNDRLMSFGGEKFEYDEIGNPTLYRNKPLVWRGRNLMFLSGHSFDYYATGLRARKNAITYQWANGNLVSETRHLGGAASASMDYFYDHSGVAGFRLIKEGEEKFYFYAKNIQGDITHIVDTHGNIVGEYKYDAWGNHTVETSVDGIAELNPFRYRGYYFDTETGLYYLKSRYYDPQTGRFINMDDLALLDVLKSQVNGLNLYAYCGNNPVMNVDPTGFFFRRAWDSVTNAASSAWSWAVCSVGSVLGTGKSLSHSSPLANLNLWDVPIGMNTAEWIMHWFLHTYLVDPVRHVWNDVTGVISNAWNWFNDTRAGQITWASIGIGISMVGLGFSIAGLFGPGTQKVAIVGLVFSIGGLIHSFTSLMMALSQ